MKIQSVFGMSLSSAQPGEEIRDREIEIPSMDEIHVPAEKGDWGDVMKFVLEQAFKFGQNDFQPRECPSLSVGDVVEIRFTSGASDLFRVLGSGWSWLGRDFDVIDPRTLPRGRDASDPVDGEVKI